MFNKSYSNSAFSEQCRPKFCPSPPRKQKVGKEEKWRSSKEIYSQLSAKETPVTYLLYYRMELWWVLWGTNEPDLALKEFLIIIIIITAANTQTMLRQARPCSKCFASVSSFSPHNSSMKQVLLLPSFKWAIGKWSNSFKIIHTVKVKSGPAPLQSGSGNHHACTYYTTAVSKCRP